MTSSVLNYLAMKQIGEIYNAVFEHCFDNVPEADNEKVAAFWFSIVARHKPYLMVTENGAATLTSNIWGDSALTDFVVSLTTSFFLQWAPTEEEKERLIKNTSQALSLNMGGMAKFTNDYRAIPKRVEGRFAGPNDIESLLNANAWLLVLVLAPQFMTIRDLLPEEPVKTKKTPPAQAA